MRSLKFGLAYTSAFLRRKTQTVLIFIIIFFSLISITLLLNQYYFRPKVTEGVIGTYLEEDLPEVVTNLTSQSLIKQDESGSPQPNLVQSFSSNKEGKTYSLRLKDNIYWIDGSEIKSSDISLNLPSVTVNYPDEKTIEFKLSDSFSPFPTLLTKPIFKKNTKIGTGPYQITEVQKDQIFIKRIKLVPNDKNLPDVIVKFYPNEKIAKNSLALGEVNILMGASDISELKSQKTLSTMSRPNSKQLVTIFYNTQDPILSDENFRLALSFASPSIKNEVEAKTSIPPQSWAFNKDTKDYLDNFEQAKVYFARVKNGKDQTINLTATSALKDVGERVVEAWRKLGVKAALRVESGVPQNFQALLIAQNIPSDPDQYALWHSTQKQTNISKISSPRLDKDLEDGRKTTDLEVRKAKYYDFQKVLMDESPATFLYFPKYNVVYRKKVEDNVQKVINLQLQNLD